MIQSRVLRIRAPIALRRLPQALEEAHGHEAARVGHHGVTGFVPLGVVLAADNVEEVTFLKR